MCAVLVCAGSSPLSDCLLVWKPLPSTDGRRCAPFDSGFRIQYASVLLIRRPQQRYFTLRRFLRGLFVCNLLSRSRLFGAFAHPTLSIQRAHEGHHRIRALAPGYYGTNRRFIERSRLHLPHIRGSLASTC